MATATVGRGSRNRLTPNQIAERKQSKALAELSRNGIKVMAERVASKLGIHNAGGTYSGPALAPLPAESDFRSAPDAKPMNCSDIANVQFLNIETAKQIFAEIAAEHPELAAEACARVERDWAALLTEAERWVLSAQAARSYMTREERERLQESDRLARMAWKPRRRVK